MSSLGITDALSAYRTATERLEQSRSGQKPGSGSAFEQLVASQLADVTQSLRTSESTALAGLNGQVSLQEVVEAVNAAELSLQKVTAVRDRVISAYQEIIRMPI